jgi:hypothetical protein
MFKKIIAAAAFTIITVCSAAPTVYAESVDDVHNEITELRAQGYNIEVQELTGLPAHALVNLIVSAKVGATDPGVEYDTVIVSKVADKNLVILSLAKDGQVVKNATLPLNLYNKIVAEISG